MAWCKFTALLAAVRAEDGIQMNEVGLVGIVDFYEVGDYARAALSAAEQEGM